MRHARGFRALVRRKIRPHAPFGMGRPIMSDSLFSRMLDGVIGGDCIDIMAHMPAHSVDFVLTDPPYLVNYRDRSGRSVINDDNDAWVNRPSGRCTASSGLTAFV